MPVGNSVPATDWFQSNLSQAGTVACSVTVPPFPAPGAASVRLKSPAFGGTRKRAATAAAAAQPKPLVPGEPVSSAQVSPVVSCPPYAVALSVTGVVQLSEECVMNPAVSLT